jgi:transcriptional regulator with XRE-family HTH domain
MQVVKRRKPSLAGVLVHYWRTRAGMTQEDLAAKIGVNRAAVSQWETGETSPREAHIKKIAEALDLSVAGFYAAIDSAHREAG